MTTALCVVCNRRQPEHGYLDAICFERLAAMLWDIEDQAAMLSAVPSMAIRTGSGGGSLKSERAPARLDVLVHTDYRSRPAGTRYPGPACASCWHDSCTDIRAWLDAYDAGATETLSILDVLHSWASIVREECPTLRRRALGLDPRPEGVNITGERDLLTRNLDWVAEQPWIDEAYADMRKLLGQLRGVNGTQPDKPVGGCYLPMPGGVCDGPIWMDAVMGHAHCGRCEATWDGAQLAMLSFELEQARQEAARPKTDDGRRMLTAQEMATRLGTTVVNVRKMASRQGIRAVLGHYDPDRFRDKACA